MEDSDVQQQIKKRARRRLVGAVFFVSVVAVVLPIVMDNEPRQVVQDVEIRIPGQDEKPFAPKFATAPVEMPPERAPVEKQAEPLVEKPAVPVVAAPEVKPVARVVETTKPEKAQEKAAEKTADKPAVKPEKTVEKPAEKKVDKPVEKKVEKTADKPAKAGEDARRAASILAGGAETKPTAKSGEFLVLIGAFSNEANVKTIKTKLGEQGIKTYSEPLETPQGKKTRVRAGPFPTREAAEKALEKMQRIGVSGVISGK